MQGPPGQSFAPFMFSPAEMTFKQDLHMQSGKSQNMRSSGGFDSPDFMKMMDDQMAMQNLANTIKNDQDFYNPRESFKKFMPRSEKKKNKKDMIDELQDFMYVPRRFFCKKHKDTEIEYCCKINENFYCRLCMPAHSGHDDTVLAEVSR